MNSMIPEVSIVFCFRRKNSLFQLHQNEFWCYGVLSNVKNTQNTNQSILLAKEFPNAWNALEINLLSMYTNQHSLTEISTWVSWLVLVKLVPPFLCVGRYIFLCVMSLTDLVDGTTNNNSSWHLFSLRHPCFPSLCFFLVGGHLSCLPRMFMIFSANTRRSLGPSGYFPFSHKSTNYLHTLFLEGLVERENGMLCVPDHH